MHFLSTAPLSWDSHIEHLNFFFFSHARKLHTYAIWHTLIDIHHNNNPVAYYEHGLRGNSNIVSCLLRCFSRNINGDSNNNNQRWHVVFWCGFFDRLKRVLRDTFFFFFTLWEAIRHRPRLRVGGCLACRNPPLIWIADGWAFPEMEDKKGWKILEKGLHCRVSQKNMFALAQNMAQIRYSWWGSKPFRRVSREGGVRG